jgi:hypothetical protein
MLMLRGAGVGSIIDDALDYIKGQAKQGAESAIPDIQAQVKATVQPYVIASLAIGLVGFTFGLAAFIGMRSMRSATRRAP